MKVTFKALDYTSDDTFTEAEYEYTGSLEEGWEIQRNGKHYLSLGAGYKLLHTTTCGVCSTDLDRRFLPFALPQVIGHELVAEELRSEANPSPKKYVVEINDTFAARGDVVQDSFCNVGIPTHSPERRVLGIDRLPGGFGSYILAPQNAMVPFEGLSSKVAVLTEPFAAALQAVTSSLPPKGSQVAVLGPRRLGSLVLAALVSLRKSRGLDFKITAIVRHNHLIKLSNEIGADSVIDLRKTDIKDIHSQFDIVYDTTSTPSGFLSAMQMAKAEVHLKTTNGQVMGGINHLTELVVDEQSILPYSSENLKFVWQNDHRQNLNIFLSPSVPDLILKSLPPHLQIFQGTFQEGLNFIQKQSTADKLPRFDLAIATSPNDIASIIRPIPGSEESLLRPRGAILVLTHNPSEWNGEASASFDFFEAGKSIRASRCGDFHLALQLLKENPEVASALEKNMISHEFQAKDLPHAYLQARDPKSVKVLIHHGEQA
jgi:threonine dehydrogenase-like Zn-dependent dehydrogenase